MDRPLAPRPDLSRAWVATGLTVPKRPATKQALVAGGLARRRIAPGGDGVSCIWLVPTQLPCLWLATTTSRSKRRCPTRLLSPPVSSKREEPRRLPPSLPPSLPP